MAGQGFSQTSESVYVTSAFMAKPVMDECHIFPICFNYIYYFYTSVFKYFFLPSFLLPFNPMSLPNLDRPNKMISFVWGGVERDGSSVFASSQ